MKVLIIDDEPEVTEMICQYMSLKNNNCTIKNSGKEGLEELHKNSFDAVILDLSMPGVSGYDILDELKKQNKISSHNILVLTALNLNLDDEEELERRGVKRVLRKPIGLQELYSMLEEITT
jgi:DNA-binding response OmpR family regulator